MRKRMIPCLMAIVILLSACTSQPSQPTHQIESVNKEGEIQTAATPKGELPIVKDGSLTLTMGISVKDSVTDYELNYFKLYVEEKTGINLDFYFFPGDPKETAQKIEMMVAANEKLPDILVDAQFGEFGKASYGQQGVVLPLNDYFDEYGYFWQKSFDKYASETEKTMIQNMMKSPDGNVYGFPFYGADPTDSQVESLYINKYWLEAMHRPIPTTTDEFYETLVAFRDLDPNGNGKKDEIPLVGYNTIDNRSDMIFILANSFIYYNYARYGRFNSENGKLSTSYTTEEFREALRYVKKLYDEKLLAPISFTQDRSQLKTMLDLPDGNDTIVGATAVHPWSGKEAFTYDKEDYSKLLEYTAIGPLKGPKGVAWSPYQNSGMRFNTFITRDCKDPIAAFRLLDFISDEHTSMISRRGEEGVDWEYIKPGDNQKGKYESLGFQPIYNVYNNMWGQVEQNKIFNIEIMFMPEALFAGITAPEYKNEIERYRDTLYMDGFSRRIGQQPEEIVMDLIYTADELSEINDIITTITDYTNAARVQFVTGELDLDKDWDKYLKQIDKMGLKKWLSVAQAAYDRMHK